MIIDSIETFPYTLLMKKKFVTSNNRLSSREGYLIKIVLIAQSPLKIKRINIRLIIKTKNTVFLHS